MTTNTNLDELLKEAKTLIKLKDFDKAIPIYEAILKINNMTKDTSTQLSSGLTQIIIITYFAVFIKIKNITETNILF